MWSDAVITNAGKALLESWVNGGVLTIDGASSGSGTVAAVALLNQTALTDEREQLSIISHRPSPEGMEY